MSHIRNADEPVQQGSSKGSEQITQNVGDDDYSGRELDVQILAEAYQKDHGHRKQGEKQLVLDACNSAAEGYNGMQQCM